MRRGLRVLLTLTVTTFLVAQRPSGPHVGFSAFGQLASARLTEIERAIRKSDLGITPQSDGKVIRLSLPPMSGEQRKKLVQQIKKQAEAAKVACRNIRRDSNKHFDDAEKNKLMTEDERDRGKAKIQDLLKSYEAKIDELAAKKEKEVMEQ